MNKVHEVKALERLNVGEGRSSRSFSNITSDSRTKAKSLLLKLTTLADPILKKRGWSVKELKEFYPSNKALLGMNVNRSVILIRLRYPSNSDSFLPWHDLVGTLCHELAHMEISPHDDKFYKLMDEIYSEVESLAHYEATFSDNFSHTSVNSSAVFTGSGHFLGGNTLVSKGKSVKQLSAEAALNRHQYFERGFTSSLGGRYLGGGKDYKNLTVEQLRNLRANNAELRYLDSKRCQCGNKLDADEYDEIDDPDTSLGTGSSHLNWNEIGFCQSSRPEVKKSVPSNSFHSLATDGIKGSINASFVSDVLQSQSNNIFGITSSSTKKEIIIDLTDDDQDQGEVNMTFDVDVDIYDDAIIEILQPWVCSICLESNNEENIKCNFCGRSKYG